VAGRRAAVPKRSSSGEVEPERNGADASWTSLAGDRSRMVPEARTRTRQERFHPSTTTPRARKFQTGSGTPGTPGTPRATTRPRSRREAMPGSSCGLPTRLRRVPPGQDIEPTRRPESKFPGRVRADSFASPDRPGSLVPLRARLPRLAPARRHSRASAVRLRGARHRPAAERAHRQLRDRGAIRPDQTAPRRTARLTWTNRSDVPQATLWFHAYWNAFKASDSTFAREETRAGGVRSGTHGYGPDDWGWTELRSARLPDGTDVRPTLRWERPDDGNPATRPSSPSPFRPPSHPTAR
jgi:hypothetical protein